MKIVYKNKDNSVSIITPIKEISDIVGLKAIAEKDVPAPYKYPVKWEMKEDVVTGEIINIEVEFEEYNTPYWIVEETDIPSNRTNRDLWVLENMPEPNGFGGDSNSFTEEQLIKLYEQGKI
jgi:hypothetical protein